LKRIPTYFIMAIIVFLLTAVFSILVIPNNSLAYEDPSKVQIHSDKGDQGKAILVFMDRIAWKDIYEARTPNLDILMDIGGIGLMNTNTGGSLSQNNAYLTLGAGSRVVGVSGSQTALPYGYTYRGERIENLMLQITGYRMVQGSIANPSIAKLHRANENRPYKVKIGALGTALREAGIKVGILGNCDNYRLAGEDGGGKSFLTSMLMDDRGIVPQGDISQSLLKEDPDWPMGIKTDYDKLMEAFIVLEKKADVIAIQLGDTSRAEDFRHQSMEYRIDFHKKRALEEGDKFIGRLLDHFDPQKDYLMILTPVGPAREIGNNNRLTPIIAAGKGIQRGWLSSGSTHRMGIVTNLDVGASILNFFGLKPLTGQGGAPIFSLQENLGKSELVEFNNKLVDIYNQRPFLIRAYVYTLIPILALSTASLLFKRKYLRWIKPMLIYIMVVPLVYLVLPTLQQPQLYRTTLVALSLSIIMTALICRWIRSTMNRILAISLLTLGSLILDQWLGMSLIKESPLGYDVIAGARFYGMGNEYMGILVGASCTAIAAIFQKFSGRKKLVMISMIIMGSLSLYTIASPRLGANVGGTIAVFTALSSLALIIQNKKIRFHSIASITVVLVILLAGMFLIDSFRVVDSQSHIGQTANAVRENGPGELLGIFNRKISMNIRLIRTTIWTRVFITSLGVMVLLLYRPVGIFNDVYQRHKVFIKGLISGTIGAVAALIFNDSGIVSAATAMVFVAPPFVLLIVDEVQGKVENGEWHDGIRFKTQGR
jgi:hypothetical protein